MTDENTQAGDNSGDFTITADSLMASLSALSEAKREVSSKAGELRNLLKQILESKGIHSDAMAMIRKIDDMPETKRADFRRCFEPMFDAMCVAKWNPAQADMLDGADEVGGGSVIK